MNLETPAHENVQKTPQNFEVFFTVYSDKNKLPYIFGTDIKEKITLSNIQRDSILI